MKKLSFLSLLMLVVFNKNLAAQVTITNASFPAVGDTLNEAIDNSPAINNGEVGGNQVWDFTSLKANIIRKNAVRPASEGSASASFPTANLLFKQLGAANAQQQYMKSSTSKIEYIGYNGSLQGGLGSNIIAVFNPTEVMRRAPMKFFDNNVTNSSLNLTLPASIIPDTLLANFPIKPDSIRVKFESNRVDLVDSWGKMNIPNGSFDVLREKRMNFTNTKVEIKVAFLGWIDLSTLLGAGGGFGGVNLGKDTIVQYHYFSNNAKEAIAVVSVDPNNLDSVLSVTFKAINIKVTDINEIFDVENVNALNLYPNPAVNEVNIKLTDIPTGNYNMVIYNILGRQMMKKSYFVNGNMVINENISILPKGNYLISLSNNTGKIINTKRLIVIRP